MRKLFSPHFGELDHKDVKYKWLIFRVHLIENQAARFNFGFASNMTLLLWCVLGGLLLHMLESNFLGMLVKPNYEKPVDSAEDVVDRGMTILWGPYYEYYKIMQFEQNDSMILKELAELVYVSKVSNIFGTKS